MDVIFALVSPRTGEAVAGAATAAFDQLWPRPVRRDAVTADGGAVLGLSHHGVNASPVVHDHRCVLLVSRWDWPALRPETPTTTEWCDRLRQDGSAATPPVTLPACVAWLPAHRTLVACRDALGEGPLWYATDNGRLAISSHPATLLALDWVGGEPDPIGLTLLNLGRAPADLSSWRGIRRLPAGHRLVFRDGQLAIDRWWRLSLKPTVPLADDATWTARTRSALDAAVARRIPATGVVGAQLSGGLDSTAVSLIASQCLSPHSRLLHTFSHLPALRWNPPRAGDESPYVEAALGCMPNAVPHACTDLGGEGRRPDGRPLMAHDRSVQLAAGQAGVVCLLSGWGGDEGVSYNGDGFLASELLRLRLPSVLRWSWRFGGRTIRGVAGVLLSKVIYQQFGFLRPSAVHPDPSRRSRREQLRALSPEVRPLAMRRDRDSRRLRSAPSAHENQRRLLTSPHIANRIDADAEWSIPAGFCFRYPLLDPEVIQVALQAPERLFVLDGQTRTLIREALRGVYPELIQNRHGKFVSHPRTPAFRVVG